jgi:NAD(P)-dependent dehydrogenase (short-subunit alcohol dehydrogenase family)
MMQPVVRLEERIMERSSYSSALVVGAGHGLSASLTRGLRQEGLAVAIAARNTAKLAALCTETGARAFACDATDAAQVAQLVADVEREQGAPPGVVVYNPSARARGPFVELDPAAVQRTLQVTSFGAFLFAQEAVKRMLPKKHGAILFTGASASVKGYAQSAPFAMGKFALRGLAQSIARELAPQGIHVAHFVIDGGIRSAARPEDPANPDALLDPDAIARTYLDVLRQPRSAWSWEIELRPWVERF